MITADRCVGLDPSLSGTGLATHDGASTITTSKQHDGSRDYLRRFHAIWAEVYRGLREIDRPLVAIEGIVKPQHASGIHTTGLHYFLRERMARHSVPYLDIAPTQVKKYALGKGGGKNTGKVDMILAARTRLDYQGNDDNQADALWLRAIVADLAGSPVVSMPKTNREVLGGLATSAKSVLLDS